MLEFPSTFASSACAALTMIMVGVVVGGHGLNLGSGAWIALLAFGWIVRHRCFTLIEKALACPACKSYLLMYDTVSMACCLTAA